METSAASGARPGDSAERLRILAFVEDIAAILAVETHKLVRDPTELATRAVQPALWLLVFGEVFTRVRAIPTGSLTYLEFMTPGVLAQSVLFIAIFYGIAVIWEKDLGIVQKLLVSPASRGALVFGKALAAGTRALSQAVIIVLLALILGVHPRFDIGSVLCVALAVVLGAALFSTFSLLVACLVKTRERFMGIGQVLTMPLFFASNAIYPLAMMPRWLQVIARVNPLSYLVDLLRVFMVGGVSGFGGAGVDFAVLTGVFLLLLFAASKLYPTLAH